MQKQKQWVMGAIIMSLLALSAMAAEAGKADKQGKKERKSDCGDWQWSVCVANVGDCGLGTREGTRTGNDCKQTIKTQRCKIPCNWKKQFGGECKYDFQAWGDCDMSTGRKNRTGILKRALLDATCPDTVSATKPCGKIPKIKLQVTKFSYITLISTDSAQGCSSNLGRSNEPLPAIFKQLSDFDHDDECY